MIGHPNKLSYIFLSRRLVGRLCTTFGERSQLVFRLGLLLEYGWAEGHQPPKLADVPTGILRWMLRFADDLIRKIEPIGQAEGWDLAAVVRKLEACEENVERQIQEVR